MGNSFPNNRYTPVGSNAGIQFKREIEDGYVGKLERWMVSYDVGGTTSVKLILKTETYNKDGNKVLIFEILDPGFLTFSIYRTGKNCLVETIFYGDLTSYETKFITKNDNNQWGGVTKTNVFYSGSESEGHLLVVEEKSKSGVDVMPCVVTVTHYYAVSSRSFISRKKYDVGLSIVVDIGLLNNDLKVSVKGPSEHPSYALLQMFQQVSRTWIWKWTSCSHCAAETQIETEMASPQCAMIEKLLSDMIRQVNSEYNGSFQQHNGRIPHKVILVNNSGNYFKGDNNGSVVIKGDAYIFNITDNFLEISQNIIKICKMLGIHIEMKME